MAAARAPYDLRGDSWYRLIHRVARRAELPPPSEWVAPRPEVFLQVRSGFRRRCDRFPCGCTRLCGRFENQFAPAVVRMVAAGASQYTRRRNRRRVRRVEEVGSSGYAMEIAGVINSYSQTIANSFSDILHRLGFASNYPHARSLRETDLRYAGRNRIPGSLQN